MAELFLMKGASGELLPADPQSAALIQRFPLGQGFKAKVTKVRNLPFHRLAFSLWNFAFDVWDAPEMLYRGIQVEKNFDRFRADTTILAGHYTAVYAIDGTTRLKPKSIAFHNMDQPEFEQVYKGLLDVCWNRVLKSKGYESPEAVDGIVQQLLRYGA